MSGGARESQALVPVSVQSAIRGDVVMRDGAVITMDEICDELGVPRLPLLEDMPPEIEIDFDQGENEEPDPTSPD